MRRNEFLESDGLFYESETHEWFNDNPKTPKPQQNVNFIL